jgi:hypothetical protein
LLADFTQRFTHKRPEAGQSVTEFYLKNPTPMRGTGRMLDFFDYQKPDNQAQDLKYQINQYL